MRNSSWSYRLDRDGFTLNLGSREPIDAHSHFCSVLVFHSWRKAVLSQAIDILILSNGPGELATWVRPVVSALQHQAIASPMRVSVVLSPCPHATGNEAEIASQIPGIDRVQSAAAFWPFLLWGRTDWDWHRRGVVVFLGGDQFFAIAIARRLGYRSVIYAEWEARWLAWGDRFAATSDRVLAKVPAKYRCKIAIVGDLIAEVRGSVSSDRSSGEELIGMLPGSKPAKLTQGVPLCLAIAQEIHRRRPQTRFVIPVAPSLDLPTLARYADPEFNPIAPLMGEVTAELVEEERPYLQTSGGLAIELWRPFPAYARLVQCCFCLTTVGANTAELGSLGVPAIVLLPTQQLDAMRAWDGLPGLLANLPGVGGAIAKLINSFVLRQGRLFAWPNIWAGEEIFPELVGRLQPKEVAEVAIAWLEHPEQLEQVRSRLAAVRGESGAAGKIAAIVAEVARS